jgi:hypothetical protein
MKVQDVLFLIGLYLGKSSIASAYGAAGSLVIIVVWVYYSAQILLSSWGRSSPRSTSSAGARASRLRRPLCPSP